MAAVVPAELKGMFALMQSIGVNAKTGIDRPEAVIRMLVLSAIQQFVGLTGRMPRLLYIPPAVEAALQVDKGRNLGQPAASHGKINKQTHLFSCRVIWSADEFKVE